ncbi:hypothetical protein H5410_003839, partial [Solanum commersonii]
MNRKIVMNISVIGKSQKVMSLTNKETKMEISCSFIEANLNLASLGECHIRTSGCSKAVQLGHYFTDCPSMRE